MPRSMIIGIVDLGSRVRTARQLVLGNARILSRPCMGTVGNAFTISGQGRPSSTGTKGNLNVSFPKLRFLKFFRRFNNSSNFSCPSFNSQLFNQHPFYQLHSVNNVTVQLHQPLLHYHLFNCNRLLPVILPHQLFGYPTYYANPMMIKYGQMYVRRSDEYVSCE